MSGWAIRGVLILFVLAGCQPKTETRATTSPPPEETPAARTSGSELVVPESEAASAQPEPAAPTASEPPPQPVSAGVLGNQWQCSGYLDAAKAQRVLDAAAPKFQQCFAPRMIEADIAKVELRVVARVGKRGSITDQLLSSQPTLSAGLSCAKKVVEGLSLPRPRGGDCVVLDYPLRFRIR